MAESTLDALESTLAAMAGLAERNRQNAQKSTGPKTDAGKAASRMNAVRHGLCTTVMLVMPGEDQHAFDTLRNGVFNSFRPADTAERVLVEQYVSIAWRLRRIGDAKAAANERELARSAQRTIGEQLLDEVSPSGWKTPPARPRMQLLAQEDRLQRMLGRTLRQLKEIRQLRQAQREVSVESPVAPPVPAVQQATAAPAPPREEAAPPPPPPPEGKSQEMPGNARENEKAQNEPTAKAVAGVHMKSFAQNEPRPAHAERNFDAARRRAGY